MFLNLYENMIYLCKNCTGMTEPIQYFLLKEGFRRYEVAEYVIGDLYVAVMNNDGNIGVCATLGMKVESGLMEGEVPDSTNPSHRVLLNAWFNSIYNYRRDYDDIKDIFDAIDFSNRGPIVMAGYFESLYDKFAESDIDLKVFDLQKSADVISDISGFSDALMACRTLILTGTTIFNNTFTDVIGGCKPGCTIYLLGPSNILSDDMFSYGGIEVVFGSVFENGNREVLRLIAEGHGTKGFLSHLKKVYIAREDRI